MNSVTKILEQLIPFKTVSATGSYLAIQNCYKKIDEHIAGLEDWSFREYSSNGHVSRVYSHQNFIDSDEKHFDFYLYANVDVVDGKDSLFTPRIEAERIYGRGAVDMKFGAAVALQTLKELPAEILRQKIALIITSDEELGGINGAKYLVDEIGYRGKVIFGPNGMVSGEKWRFETNNKGVIHTKYMAHGKSSHGSRPWQGENAIDTLIAFYEELKEKWHKGTENIWDSTLNLGIMHGGYATNAVADEAYMQTDFRYVTVKQAEEYYEFEEELLKKYNVTKELIVDAICIDVDMQSEYVTRYLEVAKKYIDEKDLDISRSHGSHDVREFFKVGMAPIIFTPRGAGNHTEKEWVNIKDLESLVKINTEYITDFFS